MRIFKSLLEMVIIFCWFGVCYISVSLINISKVEAKDFGIQGHTFEIIEEDFLEVINNRLKAVDWNRFNKNTQDKTKEYVERPTEVRNIVKAQESKEFFYDPTYVLTQDIKDHTGKLMHPAGTKVNPLEFTSLREALLFIDGDDEEQVKFALNLYKENQEKLKIILVKGAPLKLQRELKEQRIWIYFDQGGFLTSKLNIQEIPALVEQAELKLKITTMATFNDLIQLQRHK